MRELSPWRKQHPPEEAEAEYSYHPAESEGPHLRQYWKILLKHRRLIVPIFLVLFGLGAYLTFSATPLYTATATLKIEPQDPVVVQVQEMLATQAAASPYDYYQTQFTLLQSSPVAAKVITELGLESNQYLIKGNPSALRKVRSWIRYFVTPVRDFLSKFLAPAPEEDASPAEPEYGVDPGLLYNYLTDFLVVNPVKNTRLVQVMFTTPSPRLSQKLANAHVAAFIRTTLETRFELSQEAREFLQKKLGELKTKTQRAEDALQRFRQAHGVVSLEPNENIVIDRMVDLNKRLTDARAKRIEQESLYRTVANQNSRYLSEIIDNQVIQQLKTGLLALEAEQARLLATFTPDHPRLVELNAQIRQAHQRMDREITNVVHRIESDFGAARAKEEALQAEVERQQQAALNLKEVGAQYAVFQSEVDTSKVLQESILKRLNETTVSNDVPVSNLQISERAEMPTDPSSPQVPRNLLVAAAGGLFVGVGLAFFLEYMDSTIRTPDDVWRAVSVPTLGTVPHLSSLRRRMYGYGHPLKSSAMNGLAHTGAASGSSMNGSAHPVAAPAPAFPNELTLAHHPLSIIAESYRTIRTALLLSQAEQPPQVLLLTSAHPGEGKTVTTLNLAIALAQGGCTVLVIDADLRKGCCHTMLRRQNNRGLSNVLAGSLTLEEGVQATPVSGLAFLSRGTIPPNPAELLGSRRMRDILQVLRERFDFVLIDSPPTIAVSDAAVLSQLCDGVVLVMHGQKTTTEMARRAVERLEMAHARILGVVLNGIDIRNPDYIDYHQYYSSYAAAQEAQAKAEE